MANWFVDYVGGATGTGSGNSFANKSASLSSLTTVAAGDFIRLAKSPDATSMGQNATATNKSISITLTSAVTTNIYLDGAWTNSTNVTCTTDTTNKKEGANASSIAIAAAFTTGLAAYYATGTLDLSSKQQISFWIKTNLNVAANTFRIDLCSDTAGATPVNSFTINRALNSGQWTVITLDNGAVLGSAIQSVALNCLLDPGTVTVLLDNILGCNASSSADSLTLRSLISIDNVIFYPIKSINGTTVVIDSGTQSLQGAGRGFSGTTATAACYKRETIATPSVATSATVTTVQYAGATGTSVSHVNISGGWDTTGSMTTQNGATYFDGLDGFGQGISPASGKVFVDWSLLTAVRYNNGLFLQSQSQSFTSVQGIGNTLIGSAYNSIAQAPASWTNCNFFCNGNDGLQVTGNGSAGLNSSISGILSFSNLGNGISFPLSGNGVSATSCTCNNNTLYGLNFYPNQPAQISFASSFTANDNGSSGINVSGVPLQVIYGLTCNGNSSYGIATGATVAPSITVYGYTSASNTSGSIQGGGGCKMIVYNATMSEATKLAITAGRRNALHSHREGGVATVNKIYTDLGTIQSQTTTTQTGSGIAWQFNPTDTTYTSALCPLSLSIRRFGIKSGVPQTFTFWCRRDNTNLNMQLRIPGGRFPGVGSAGTDITTTVNPSINTWTQYSISCTPSEDCVIEVFMDTWDNNATTHNGYVDGLATVA